VVLVPGGRAISSAPEARSVVRRFRYRGETTAPKRHVAVSGGGAENLKGFELEDLEARIEQLENRDTKEIRPNSNLRLAA
jgi:hypothetical protein